MPTTWATWLNGARTVIFAMENQRPPRFLGNPHVNHALLSDPADGLAPGVAAQTLLPSTLKTVSASGSYSFRGSITRPGDPLCTLRGQGRPCTTQHSVPAGCQPLPGRLSSCRVPSEAFSRVLPHMTPHSSRLNLAHFQQNRPAAASRDSQNLPFRLRLADARRITKVRWICARKSPPARAGRLSPAAGSALREPHWRCRNPWPAPASAWTKRAPRELRETWSAAFLRLRS